MTTGERIRSLRLAQKMSQEELGRRIGLQKAAIHKYETGLVVNIKQTTLDRLAQALNTTPAWLLGLDEPSLTPEEVELLRLYRAAPAELQAAVRRIVKE